MFDIASLDVYAKPDELRDVFRIQNRIIHELDIDFSGTNRKRVPRSKIMMKSVNVIFHTASAILSQLDRRC